MKNSRSFFVMTLSIAMWGSWAPFGLSETRVSGVVSGVWDRNHSPYIATGNITIRNGDTLQVGPGVEVRFEGNYTMFVLGTLIVEGEERDSVFFGPVAGGETWGGIRFLNADEGTRMAYAIVIRGSATQGQGDIDTLASGGNIFIYGSPIKISRSRIAEGLARSTGGGIAIWRASPLIENSLITSNRSQLYGGGISVMFGSQPILRGTVIEANTAQVGGGGIVFFAENLGEVDRCVISRNRVLNVDNGVGGGMFILEASSPYIHHTQFLENGAPSGGGIYIRNEGSNPVVEWCYFYGNAANEGSRVGGGLYIRGYSGIEVRYTIFKQNNANYGGGIYVKEPPRCRLHHNLFIQNGATRAGGAVATSNDLGEHHLGLVNCTFIDNRNIGGERIAHTIYARQGSFIRINSSIVVGMQPHFGEPNQIAAVYSHIQGGFPGEGNEDQDPGFFQTDTALFLLRGNSTCRNSGDPNLGLDPDSSRVDRGWVHFPEDALRGLEQREIEVGLRIGERDSVSLALTNRTPVPFVANLMDRWQAEAWRLLIDGSAITNDRSLMAVARVGNRYFVAGGNNGQNNPRIYILDEEFNLRGSFRQPGNSNGLGFLDLATDGRQTLYGSYERFVVEFSVDGELGDELAAPQGVSTVRGLGVDHTYAQDFRDFYVGGDEGFVAVTDGELWQRDSIFVGDTVRSIAVKRNSRFLYLMTEPRPGLAMLNLVDVDRKKVIPLYPLFSPRQERIGGIEIFHDPSDSKGVLIGIWKGEDNASDRIFALDLYTTWIVSLPQPMLLFPGDTAVWKVTIAGDQVEPGIYEDHIFLTVNGWGEGGEVRLTLWASDNVNGGSSVIAPDKPILVSCYPQPFNSQSSVQFFLPVPLQFQWRVIDATGRTRLFGQPVFGYKGLNTLNLNLATLPSGIYFLNVEFTTKEPYPTLRSPLVLIK